MANPKFEDSERARLFGVGSFLGSIRRSLDRLRGEGQEVEDTKEVLLQIEATRISFRPKWGEDVKRADTFPYLARLAADLRELLGNPKFQKLARSVPFRLTPLRVDQASRWLKSVADQKMSVEEAARLLLGHVEESVSVEPEDIPKSELVQLRHILPQQKIAPTQFEIRNGRLALINVTSRSEAEDSDNILAARQGLKSSGDKILKELKGSNCDRRLIENVQYLQELLS